MTEQPPYSLLVRGIDADALPVADQFAMGVCCRGCRLTDLDHDLATSWI